ncbi:NADH-quinone oxidoreductase subunit 5 family protein [Mycobacterium antarcticum]|uniref:NADH-quinone oxidoreductase subunit 5 family protein n=1 Tax=unclassified Mycolicibacterium TaxID=2636767 RepID=UPI0024E088DF|nr:MULTISPECIES: proton-conducting transporter membrane subunit [unclassified Mycolicibacterium]
MILVGLDAGQAALVATVLMPALVGTALTLGARADRLAGPISVAAAAVTCALSVVAAVSRPTVGTPFMAGSELALGVDELSGLVLPTVTAVTLLVLVFAAGDITESRRRFHGLMLLFAAAVNITVTAATLPALLLGWEVMGATSYALIGFRWREPKRVDGGLTAFLTTRSADLGLYLAAATALAGGAGLAIADLPAASPGWRHVIAAGILVAALGKAAQLPFSFWLSRAMEGPSPVSALLHSAAMVAMGGYLLLRNAPLLASTGWADSAAAWIGALTAVALGVIAVAQRDLKQLLAASTASQLGFVVMAAGLGAVSGGAAQLVAHAATKALLFLTAGAWLSALGTKHLDGLRGVARRWPTVGWTATVGALSLAGIAPLSLWLTKDAVLAAALETSPWLYAVGLLGAAVSAAYAGKIVVVIWRRPDRELAARHLDEEEPGTRTVGLLEATPLVVLAAGAAVLGVLAPAAPATELTVSAVIAIVILLAVTYLVPRGRLPELPWALPWFGMESAMRAVIVVPTVRLAHALAVFDDRVVDRGVHELAARTIQLARGAAHADDHAVDGVVRKLAAGTTTVAQRAARVDDHDVDGVVNAVAAATRKLGRLARKPQTGMVHDYYFQAAAMLAIGIALLYVVSR